MGSRLSTGAFGFLVILILLAQAYASPAINLQTWTSFGNAMKVRSVTGPSNGSYFGCGLILTTGPYVSKMSGKVSFDLNFSVGNCTAPYNSPITWNYIADMGISGFPFNSTHSGRVATLGGANWSYTYQVTVRTHNVYGVSVQVYNYGRIHSTLSNTSLGAHSYGGVYGATLNMPNSSSRYINSSASGRLTASYLVERFGPAGNPQPQPVYSGEPLEEAAWTVVELDVNCNPSNVVTGCGYGGYGPGSGYIDVTLTARLNALYGI